MGRYYEKSVGNGEKLLYDSDGKCIGRGVTDKNGKTIYSGESGCAGKSYEAGHSTVKYFDADNNYVGGGIKRSGVSKIEGHKNTERKATAVPDGDGCATSLILMAIVAGIIFLFSVFS